MEERRFLDPFASLDDLVVHDGDLARRATEAVGRHGAPGSEVIPIESRLAGGGLAHEAEPYRPRLSPEPSPSIDSTSAEEECAIPGGSSYRGPPGSLQAYRAAVDRARVGQK